MKWKAGVTLPPIHPGLHHALDIAEMVWRVNFDAECVVTSVSDGRHMPGSLHFGIDGDLRARAADLRIWMLTEREQGIAVAELRRLLGDAFDVVHEGSHIHLELDVRRYSGVPN